MFCSRCGYKHGGNLKYCPMCGNCLIEVNQPMAVQPAATNVAQTAVPVQQQLQVTNQNYVGQTVPNYGVVSQQVQTGYQYPVNNQLVASNDPTKKSKKNLIIFIILILLFIALGFGFYFILNKDGTKSREKRDYEEGTRTVMIYMVGSNLESDSAIATSDINSIKASEVDLENVNVLLYTGGTAKWHNFVSNDENAIYQLTESGFEKVKTYSKQNMGSSTTFETFLNYAYDNYVTEHYDLIIYDHGGAIDGAVWDDFTADNLSLEDFETALKNSPFDKDNKLEVVLFRTCLNGTIEVASVFDEYAEYLVASSEVTLGSRFTPVLGFLNDVEPTDTAVDFGEKFIDEYQAQMNMLDPYGEVGQMYAIVDLSKTDDIVVELEKFIKGIDLDTHYADVVRARSSMFQFAYTYFDDSSYDMVDLYELVERLSPYSTVDSKKLLSLIDEAVIYNWSTISDTHGLSIYFPYNGDNMYQAYFLNIYDEFEFNKSYFDFINNFSILSRSNKNSAFSNTLLIESETSVKGTEFELKLTEEQTRDYAKSGYIIFHKEEDGYYTPIYSSDDTVLKSDGTLSTNISNNLIKVYDEEAELYVQLIERTVNGEKVYYSNVTLFSSEGEISDWKTDRATVYYDYQGNDVKVTNIILNGDDHIEGTIAKLEDYTTIQFWNFRYKILDKNGNYTDDWESSSTYYGYEFYTNKEFNFKRATLDKGDYYCIFVVKDIYGNTYYSKLLSVD